MAALPGGHTRRPLRPADSRLPAPSSPPAPVTSAPFHLKASATSFGPLLKFYPYLFRYLFIYYLVLETA